MSPILVRPVRERHPGVRLIIHEQGRGSIPSRNEMAAATINACAAAEGAPARTLEQLVAAGTITYVPFPPALVGKYQSFTQADLSALRSAGYVAPMASVEEGVTRYVERLMAGTV